MNKNKTTRESVFNPIKDKYTHCCYNDITMSHTLKHVGNKYYCEIIDKHYKYECECELDSNNNLLYKKRTNIRFNTTEEEWFKYNENNDLINYKSSNGYEEQYDYNKEGKLVHRKSSKNEEWTEYDENGRCVHYKLIEFDGSGDMEVYLGYDDSGKLISRKIIM